MNKVTAVQIIRLFIITLLFAHDYNYKLSQSHQKKEINANDQQRVAKIEELNITDENQTEKRPDKSNSDESRSDKEKIQTSAPVESNDLTTKQNEIEAETVVHAVVALKPPIDALCVNSLKPLYDSDYVFIRSTI